MVDEKDHSSRSVTPGPITGEGLLVDPRRFTEGVTFPDPRLIRVYDTTLRDGEQTPGVAFSPEQKYTIARLLSDAGVHIIDVGFPSVASSEREALRRIIRGKREGTIRDDLEILVMCRAVRTDVDAILRTLDEVGAAPDEITFLTFTSASDLHIRVKLRDTLLRREGASDRGKDPAWFREANVRMMEDICSYIRDHGVREIEFGTEDASRSDVEYLIELVRRTVAVGATRYIFPDTTGSLTPEATRFYVRRLLAAFPDLPMVCHFHNDFDLAAVNTIIALQEGMHGFSVTVNGIGERAGNAALHNVVVPLKVLYDVTIPGFRYDLLKPLSELVESCSGVPVGPCEPAMGRNVFAHESGIHAHGVLREPRTYEPIPRDLLGTGVRFVYGKHTGLAILSATLEEHRARFEAEGLLLDDDLKESVLESVKAARERRAVDGSAQRIIADYRSLLARLEIGENEILDIALAEARARAAGTGG